MKFKKAICSAALFATLSCWTALAVAAGDTTLIVNARIVDGTGAPAADGAVRIAGDRIVAVGDLKPSPG